MLEIVLESVDGYIIVTLDFSTYLTTKRTTTIPFLPIPGKESKRVCSSSMSSRLILLRLAATKTSGGVKGLRLQSRFLVDAVSSRGGSGGAVIRRTVSKEERVQLRAARREQAAQTMQELQAKEGGQSMASSSAGTASTTSARQRFASRWIWYLGFGIPSALLVWGLNDENSPPAKISELIGLTSLITSFTDQIAKPAHEKLLPDWSQASPRCCRYFSLKRSMVLQRKYKILQPLHYLSVSYAIFFILLYFVDAECTTRHSCTTYTCAGSRKNVGLFDMGSEIWMETCQTAGCG